eukprot:CAMPEP_0168484616 /NCGR_PEP_ID=MMETSP0228-20121227/66188_1 /TAXON_ID=133427 /ORGANISM="Protoceratium reticulatum, Strain CCCM 535 (=CCMP 1889)" /LENGTH=215 /DNA_ID=CAMNT_0008501159 /DNA_START=173 /DNA_END=818 /DNA_ORIENTATION=-
MRRHVVLQSSNKTGTAVKLVQDHAKHDFAAPCISLTQGTVLMTPPDAMRHPSSHRQCHQQTDQDRMACTPRSKLMQNMTDFNESCGVACGIGSACRCVHLSMSASSKEKVEETCELASRGMRPSGALGPFLQHGAPHLQVLPVQAHLERSPEADAGVPGLPVVLQRDDEPVQEKPLEAKHEGSEWVRILVQDHGHEGVDELLEAERLALGLRVRL